jgi:hypothetical protein
MKRLLLATLLALILGFAPIAHAALINNGGGLIYDTGLNVTWYDYSYNGTWGGAVSWAASLKVGGVMGWRLPLTLPVNGSTYNYNWSYNGSTDYASNISAPGSAYPGTKGSEMAYLYYVELGNVANTDMNGNSLGNNPVNTGPFTSLQPGVYWSGTEYAPGPGRAWSFLFETFPNFAYGGQGSDPQTFTLYALAVHDGDVGAPVPIPGAILLFAPGLLGLAAIRRRFKK